MRDETIRACQSEVYPPFWFFRRGFRTGDPCDRYRQAYGRVTQGTCSHFTSDRL